MGWLYVISILLVVLYVGTTIWKKKRVPESISAMVYDLPRSWQWLWIVWMELSTFCLAPILIERMPDSLRFLGFFLVSCLIFIGAMPIVENSKNTVHNALAIIAGILTQVCVLILCPWCFLAWVILLWLCLYTVYKDVPACVNGSGLFFVEACCWLSLVLSLI